MKIIIGICLGVFVSFMFSVTFSAFTIGSAVKRIDRQVAQLSQDIDNIAEELYSNQILSRAYWVRHDILRADEDAISIPILREDVDLLMKHLSVMPVEAYIPSQTKRWLEKVTDSGKDAGWTVTAP